MDRGIENPALRAAYFAGAMVRGAGFSLGVKTHDGGWVTLYYHSVSALERRRFQRQAAIAAARAVPTASIGAAARRSGGPGVCLTFDDGFASLLDNAVGALEEHAVPATVFAVSGNLGRKPEWRLAAGDADSDELLMTAAQLRSLPAGLITIGSHTVTHRRLDEITSEQARAELADSKRALEDILARAVTALAFPHGAYNETVVALAYDAGYTQLFTIEACVYPGPLPSGLIGRFAASPSESEMEFRLRIAGAYDWLYRVRQAKRRLMDPSAPTQPRKQVTVAGVKIDV